MGPHGPVWARMDPYISNYIFVYVADNYIVFALLYKYEFRWLYNYLIR